MRKPRLLLAGAATVVLLLLGFASTSLAVDTDKIEWDGMGLPVTQKCEAGEAGPGAPENTPYLLWLLSPDDGIATAELFIDGVSQGMGDHGGGNFKWITGVFSPLNPTAHDVYV